MSPEIAHLVDGAGHMLEESECLQWLAIRGGTPPQSLARAADSSHSCELPRNHNPKMIAMLEAKAQIGILVDPELPSLGLLLR